MAGHIAQRVASGPPRDGVSYRTGALASTYDDLAWFPIPMGADRVSLAFKYTLVGSTTGHATIRPTYKSDDIDGETFRDVDTDSPVVVGAKITKPVRELELDLPVPPVDSVSDVIVIRVPPGMTHVAFPAAETGDPSNPGTLLCWALAGV
ncbi:MAG: hypothetical protein U0441_14960 [Polyangiaceae bacterium]